MTVGIEPPAIEPSSNGSRPRTLPVLGSLGLRVTVSLNVGSSELSSPLRVRQHQSTSWNRGSSPPLFHTVSGWSSMRPVFNLTHTHDIPPKTFLLALVYWRDRLSVKPSQFFQCDHGQCSCHGVETIRDCVSRASRAITNCVNAFVALALKQWRPRWGCGA
mgnify:CR=1 FL=1